MDENIEKIISNNLVELRKSHNLKQSDLSDKIGYSDKTISRWENGSAVPDIMTLITIAKFYNIGVEDIVKENAKDKSSNETQKIEKENLVNSIAMLLLSVLTIWTIAVLIYVGLIITKSIYPWQIFVCAVPVSAVVFYRQSRNILSIRWLNTVLLSIAVWSFVAVFYLFLLEYNFWQLFFLPIPIECMIIIYTLFTNKDQTKKQHKFFRKK